MKPPLDPDPLTVAETRAEHRGYEQGTVRLREIRVRRTREHFVEVVLGIVAGLVIGYIAGASRVSAGSPSEPVVGSHPPLAVPSVSVPATDSPLAPIGGQATWYCSSTSPCTVGYRPTDLVAAIDPSLGIPKGARVRVDHEGRTVVVLIVDVCACKDERVIDLTSGAFSKLAPLSLGVIPVSITELGAGVTPPATETEP